MSVPDNFVALLGNWSGSNRLHMPWMTENPISDSDSSATVATAGNGKFLKIDYDWNFQGERQEGLLILCVAKSGNAETSWLDSFHSSGGFLLSKGEFKEGRVLVKGSYSVPDHPDWGWRTELETDGADAFSFTMWNVSPEGEEDIAVEAKFTRK